VGVVKVKQDMCRVCFKAFNSKDVVIQFWEWVDSGQPNGPWCRLCATYFKDRKEKTSTFIKKAISIYVMGDKRG